MSLYNIYETLTKVNADGTTELIADMSAFVQANPVATPNPADFEPDEGAYGMAELDGMLASLEVR